MIQVDLTCPCLHFAKLFFRPLPIQRDPRQEVNKMMHAQFCLAFERAVVMTYFFPFTFEAMHKIVSHAQLFFKISKSENYTFLPLFAYFIDIVIVENLVTICFKLFKTKKVEKNDKYQKNKFFHLWFVLQDKCKKIKAKNHKIVRKMFFEAF